MLKFSKLAPSPSLLCLQKKNQSFLHHSLLQPFLLKEGAQLCHKYNFREIFLYELSVKVTRFREILDNWKRRADRKTGPQDCEKIAIVSSYRLSSVPKVLCGWKLKIIRISKWTLLLLLCKFTKQITTMRGIIVVYSET